MDPGRLIVLNGGSSAGKSSLARAFQDVAPDCWLLLGIDLFWGSLPPGEHNLNHVDPEYYSWTDTIGDDGREYFVIRPGPILDRVMYARYAAIRAYLDQGLDVIADEVAWRSQWLRDAAVMLEGYTVWFIGVHVSDAEGARREIQRGDRHGGWNRGSARAAHANARGIYDLEIDTSDRPPQVLARELAGGLAGCPEPDALERLRRVLDAEAEAGADVRSAPAS